MHHPEPEPPFPATCEALIAGSASPRWGQPEPAHMAFPQTGGDTPILFSQLEFLIPLHILLFLRIQRFLLLAMFHHLFKTTLNKQENNWRYRQSQRQLALQHIRSWWYDFVKTFFSFQTQHFPDRLARNEHLALIDQSCQWSASGSFALYVFVCRK